MLVVCTPSPPPPPSCQRVYCCVRAGLQNGWKLTKNPSSHPQRRGDGGRALRHTETGDPLDRRGRSHAASRHIPPPFFYPMRTGVVCKKPKLINPAVLLRWLTLLSTEQSHVIQRLKRLKRISFMKRRAFE